jgi:hypothetical protein
MKWARPGVIVVIVVIVAAIMGAAAAVQQALTVRDRRRFPPPGLLVNVDGHQMHLQVRGPRRLRWSFVMLSGRLALSRRMCSRGTHSGACRSVRLLILIPS